MLKRKKKSVIVGWAYSYSVILLIPILTIFVNYYFNIKVIRQGTMRANEQVLDNLTDSIDELIEDEKAFYSYIYTLEAFDSTMVHREKDACFYYDASRLREKLSTYCMYNGEVSSVLYFVNKDYVMNASSANEDDIFYESIKFYNPSMQDYESWKMMMTAEYNNEFLVQPFMHHKTTKECIVYADTIEQFDSKVNIFISFPVDEIIKRAGGMGNGSRLVISIGGENLLTISNGRIVDAGEKVQLSEGKDDFFEIEGYMGLCRKSYDKKISYYLLVPENGYWKEVRNTQNILIVSICFTLFLGCVCVTFLLKRNFEPISGLLSTMSVGKKKGNEFEQIEEIYNDLITKNKSMNEVILTQKEIVNRNALLAMMKGRNIDYFKSEDFHIHLHEQEKIVLVGFEIPLTDVELIKHDELLHFIVDNIFMELMSEERVYRIEDGQYIFYLFIIDESNEEWKRNCIEKINFICEFMEDKLKLTLAAVVSSSDTELEHLRFLYQDAMDAFAYKEIIGGSGVMDIDALKEEGDISAMGISVGNKIVIALEKCDQGKMMENLEEFFNHSKQLPFIIFRMRVMELFQIVAQNFCDFEQDEEKRIRLFSYLKPLLEETSMDIVKKNFEEFLRFVYSVFHEEEQEAGVGIVAKIKECIETNYMDSTLNISSIANRIGKNPKYIARVFKSETQEGILDYINGIRIKKAIVLIRSGKYSIEEISAKVGYATCKTFRRSFIKMMGVTPGKFETQNNNLPE